MVKEAYQKGMAINAATSLEFDEVIDPKETRKWIRTALESIPSKSDSKNEKRFIDSW